MKFWLLILLGIVLGAPVKTQDYYFPPLSGIQWDTISPDSLGWCQENIDSLYAFLDSNNTKSFILLKDGNIVLEKYLNGHSQSMLWQWASAGKTITSLLVGIAQEENYLNIQDPSSQYLGLGWTTCDSTEESQIKIRHHLSMTTAMNDLFFNCTDPGCFFCIDVPGQRWSYHNGPYRLLTDIVSIATGETYNAYTTQKLKSKTGMDGFWINTNALDLYYSTARSMARFGSLILNDCIWNADTVLADLNYKTAMITPSQTINESYGYLWWLNGFDSHMLPLSQEIIEGSLAPDAPADLIFGAGKDGQFCEILPSENIVVVRMGENPDGEAVPIEFHAEMWDYITPIIFGPDTLIWYGTEDNIWHNSANWDKLCLPGPRTHVIINSSNIPVHLDLDSRIKSMYIENEQSLIIQNDAKLTIGSHQQ